MPQFVVISKKYGGFGVSNDAHAWLRKHGQKDALEEKTVHELIEEWERDCEQAGYPGLTVDDYNQVADSELRLRGACCKMSMGNSGSLRDIARDDPLLVQCVRELGDAASSRFSNLVVVEVPDGVEWEIDEYDGFEKVVEVHRSWS